MRGNEGNEGNEGNKAAGGTVGFCFAMAGALEWRLSWCGGRVVLICHGGKASIKRRFCVAVKLANRRFGVAGEYGGCAGMAGEYGGYAGMAGDVVAQWVWFSVADALA